MKLLLILLFPLAAFCQTSYKPHAILIATGDTLWINTTKDSIFKRVNGNITFAYKPKFKNLSSQFAGGSTGQVPVKNSNTDYDWTWGNPSASASFGALTGVYSDNASLVSAFAGKQDAGSYATASHNHSGVYQPADGDLDYLAGFTPTANVKSILNAADYADVKTLLTVNNVDNTSDANKPVSTATQAGLDTKQATLVSGTNIKTINGSSVLGSGDLVVSGSGAPTFINLASLFSSTSTTPAVVTGWSFAVTTGKTYRVTVIADYQTAATTTGGILGISLTTATGSVRGFAEGSVSQSAVATELKIPIRATSGTGSTLTTTGVSVINSPHYIGLDITFTCTNSGTFNIVWATEVATSAAQLNANSSLIYQALN